MKHSTQLRGDITESYVISKCLENGWSVLKPFSHHPYDIVIDKGDGFEKVEIKSSVLKNGKIIIDISRVRYNGNNKRKKNYYTKEETDYIATYNMDLKKAYLIKVDDKIGTTYLRIDPPKNNQKTGIKWAKDYEI